jgi:[acyl-carrier-protein] S-malonyltransferase
MIINKKNTAIIFPGQGSQSVGMGKDIYDNFKYVRDIFTMSDDILKTNLTKIILEGPNEILTETQNTQPALMLVSLALVEVMKKEFGWEISQNCSFVAGHSLGEYSAICASGGISIEQAAKLLKIRGQSMFQCGKEQKGAMAAVLGKEIFEIEEISKQVEECEIANDNSNGQVVVSGSVSGVDDFINIAKENGIKKIIKLPVSGAFHSRLMANAAIKMQEVLKEVDFQDLNIDLINNVEAQRVRDGDKIKNLLVEQITSRVRWRESMLLLEKNEIENFIEIGSGKVLCGLVGRTCKNANTISIQSLGSIKGFFNK